MHINVRGQKRLISNALKSYTEGRVRSRLEHIAAPITSVVVQVADLNGPRGGIDKRAGISARLLFGGPLYAEARGADAYDAVDRAVSRLVTGTARRIGRFRA
ncbi:MAG: HPF/RaiA family ribosome-associated protein [Vicinamibacterales bacterium]